MSVDLARNKDLPLNSLKLAYNDFLRLEPEVRHFVKYTCSTIENTCLDVPAVLDTKGVTQFSSLFRLEPPVLIDFELLEKHPSETNLDEQKASVKEETIGSTLWDNHDKDNSSSEKEETKGCSDANTMKHKTAMVWFLLFMWLLLFHSFRL